MEKRPLTAVLSARPANDQLVVQAQGDLECRTLTETPMLLNRIEGTKHTTTTWIGNIFWGAAGLGAFGYGVHQASTEKGADESEADVQMRRTWSTTLAFGGTAVVTWVVHKLLHTETQRSTAPTESKKTFTPYTKCGPGAISDLELELHLPNGKNLTSKTNGDGQGLFELKRSAENAPLRTNQDTKARLSGQCPTCQEPMKTVSIDALQLGFKLETDAQRSARELAEEKARQERVQHEALRQFVQQFIQTNVYDASDNAWRTRIQTGRFALIDKVNRAYRLRLPPRAVYEAKDALKYIVNHLKRSDLWPNERDVKCSDPIAFETCEAQSPGVNTVITEFASVMRIEKAHLLWLLSLPADVHGF